MRLAEGANAVASYNVAFSDVNNVRSWALQASDDHTTWITLDEKSSAEVSAIAPSGTDWCNGGKQRSRSLWKTYDSAYIFERFRQA